MKDIRLFNTKQEIDTCFAQRVSDEDFSKCLASVHNGGGVVYLSKDYQYFTWTGPQSITYKLNYSQTKTANKQPQYIVDDLTDISEMFISCTALTLDLSHLDTRNVERMGYTFTNSQFLSNINISGFNTEMVTTMSHMFNGLPNIRNLDLSSFKTPLLENTEMMFSGCSMLQSIDMSNFDTSHIYAIGSMFEGCTSLTSIKVSNCTQETKDRLKQILKNLGDTFGSWNETNGVLNKN